MGANAWAWEAICRNLLDAVQGGSLQYSGYVIRRIFLWVVRRKEDERGFRGHVSCG